jgi:kynurenine formamidase
MTKRIIDLSHRLEPATPVYPNYQPFHLEVLETTEDQPNKGRRSLNSSRIGIGMHCGTHMDSPFHFISGGRTIDQVPLEQCVGPCLLIRLPDRARGRRIEMRELEKHAAQLRELRKVVLDTGWGENWGQSSYFSEHPIVSGAAAKFLVDCGVHLVGVDLPSVDCPPFEAHLELLGHETVILENLTNLEQIQSDVFKLIALPLKLNALEASPVRAIAVEVD